MHYNFNHMEMKILNWIMLGLLFGGAYAQEKPVVFAHISDTHIGNETGVKDLRLTVKDINANDSIAWVIITGDITEFGSKKELEEAKKEFDLLKKPWYIIPGNHDTKWSESGCHDFGKVFGAETFCFQYNGIWFLGTSSGPNMRMGPGQTPKEHIVWLEQKLQTIGKEPPIVYVNHYPQNEDMNNGYAVLDMLRNYNVQLFMCGHGHRNKQLDIEGVPGIMGRSNLRANAPVGGYNIVSIRNGKISYCEKNPERAVKSPWYVGNWKPAAKILWNEKPPRPNFAVNDSFPSVHIQWRKQETADIGGGICRSNEIVCYTTSTGDIKAVNLKTGKPVWDYSSESKIYSTPVIHKKIVWVSTASGNVLGLDKRSGDLKHRLSTNGAIVSTPALHGDTLFVAGSDGHCRAWRLTDQVLLWDFNGINNFVETRPLVKGGVIYFGSWGNEFYALQTATGKLLWKWSNNSANRMFSSAAVWPEMAGGKLFMVAPDRFMTALDPMTGREIWRYGDKINLVRESMGVSDDGSLVYVKTMGGRVVAFDAHSSERKIQWQSPLKLGYDISPVAIVEQNDVVFIPTQSGVVAALNKNSGAVLWKYKLTNCLITSIVPVTKNQLLVSTMDGMIALLKW